MEMKVTIYKNTRFSWELLNGDFPYYTVNTPHPLCTTYEEIEIEIPEKYNPRKSETGQILVDLEIPDIEFEARIADDNGYPIMFWYGENKECCLVFKGGNKTEYYELLGDSQ